LTVVVVAPAADVVVGATESRGAVVLAEGDVVDVAADVVGDADELEPPLHPLATVSTSRVAIVAPLDLIRPAWHGQPREDVS